jgi:DNA-binding GntR family transcriptional regulator
VKTIKHSRERKSHSKAHALTAADAVFSKIVADIQAGVVRPRDRLSERELVHRFGVSRTPVREAIKRLYERGFLEFGPKRVAIVKEVTEKSIQDLYRLRVRLESEAALLTAKHITTAELQKLRHINREFAKAYRARNLGWMLDVRAQFHAALVEATRDTWLAKILILLREEAYVVRYAHWQDPTRASQAIQMHQQMIDALAAKKPARYREIVLRQISDGLDTYLSTLRPTPGGVDDRRISESASRLGLRPQHKRPLAPNL